LSVLKRPRLKLKITKLRLNLSSVTRLKLMSRSL
jgi:hypothetical protein